MTKWTKVAAGYHAIIAGASWHIERLDSTTWGIWRYGIFCTTRPTMAAAKQMAETDHTR